MGSESSLHLRRQRRGPVVQGEKRLPQLLVRLGRAGQWVERSETGKRADVQVFTPMGRGAEFMARESDRLDEPSRRLIAQTLAARYPVIEE